MTTIYDHFIFYIEIFQINVIIFHLLQNQTFSGMGYCYTNKWWTTIKEPISEHKLTWTRVIMDKILTFCLLRSLPVINCLDQQLTKCYQHWIGVSVLQKQISHIRVKTWRETQTCTAMLIPNIMTITALLEWPLYLKLLKWAKAVQRPASALCWSINFLKKNKRFICVEICFVII